MMVAKERWRERRRREWTDGSKAFAYRAAAHRVGRYRGHRVPGGRMALLAEPRQGDTHQAVHVADGDSLGRVPAHKPVRAA
mgnify:CR=1 FL=1